MIALDTNVLIRFFVRDDPRQAAQAKAIIERAKGRGEAIFLNFVVLCEMVWVLECGYDYSRQEILLLLERIMSTRQFEVQESEIVWQALDDYRSSAADFADCLIGRVNAVRGVERTFTFDKTLRSLPQFEQI